MLRSPQMCWDYLRTLCPAMCPYQDYLATACLGVKFSCITYFASIRRACSLCTFTPTAGHEGPEGEMYSPTLSLTSALDGVGGQRHAPAALTLGKTRCPLYRRLGGPHGRSGRVRKISPTPGFDSRTVQPVVRRYTD
jgi:hypothetical protein